MWMATCSCFQFLRTHGGSKVICEDTVRGSFGPATAPDNIVTQTVELPMGLFCSIFALIAVNCGNPCGHAFQEQEQWILLNPVRNPEASRQYAFLCCLANSKVEQATENHADVSVILSTCSQHRYHRGMGGWEGGSVTSFFNSQPSLGAEMTLPWRKSQSD